MNLLTHRIKDIRVIELAQRKRLLHHERCNPAPTYKAAAKSACRAYIYECKMFIRNALELNSSICKSMSSLMRNESCFNSDRISLESQSNVRRLHDINVVMGHIDVTRKPQFMRQDSNKWKQFRKSSHITGSTAYSALGFRGVSHIRSHFREFIHKKGPRQFDTATQARLDYGREHEVSTHMILFTSTSNSYNL